MGIAEKLLATLLAAGLLAGAAWYAVSEMNAQAETIGQLESEQRKLKQALEDASKETRQTRSEMELWRDLYGDLQSDFQAIREERAAMTQELAELRERPDVQEYLDCPMPDDLYDWVREN